MSDAAITLIIAFVIFLATGIIWIKISDYFLSAVDIVGHSRFSYWVRKYISGFFFGAILAFVYIGMWGPSRQTDEIKPSQPEKSSQKPQEENKTQQSFNPINLNCTTDNQIIRMICSDKELTLANNKYQTAYISLPSNVSDEQAQLINDKLNKDLSECNMKSQCIYFSFQEATIALENLKK